MPVLKFPKAKSEEPFDLESLRLTPETMAELPVTPKEPSKRKPRQNRSFVHMTVEDFLAGAEVLDSKKELLVWVFILRQWRIVHPEPVAMANVGLSAWGVGRQIKYRAIEKLARAGLIQVQARGKASPRVKPLHVRL